MSDDVVLPEAIQNGYTNEVFSPDQEISKLERENKRIEVT